MSNNIEMSLYVETEEELRPAGFADEPLFQAERLMVTEEISRTYQLSINVAARRDDLELADLVGRRVKLRISRHLAGSDQGLHSRDFHGIVTSAQQRDRNAGLNYYFYWLKVRPAVQSLDRTVRSHIHGCDEPCTAPELVETLLTEGHRGAASASGSSMRSDISYTSSYQFEDWYVDWGSYTQYNESDLKFMQRLMERYGIFFYFDPYGDKEEMVIADHNTAFKYGNNAQDIDSATSLQYCLPTKFAPGKTFKVKNFIARHSWRSENLTLTDYNYRIPAEILQVEKELDASGEGTIALDGMRFQSNSDDGELLAERHQELVLSDQEYFSGQSDCFELCAGFIFQLSGHFRTKYVTKRDDKNHRVTRGYLVTRVEHECRVPLPGQDWDDDKHGHSADFTAIDSDVPYRPAKKTPIPQVPGLITATIDSADEGERADLDQYGRYLVRPKFDLSGHADGSCSRRVRMAQPFGGSQEGIHLPLRKGVEVLISFINGDIDRPIIIGSAPNPLNVSPVREENRTRGRIVSASSITQEFEDGLPRNAPANAEDRVAAPPTCLASGDGTVVAVGQRPPAAIPVAAPPDAGDGQLQSDPMLQGEQPDTGDNWWRLYVPHGEAMTYLRLGAVPDDEETGQLEDWESGEIGWSRPGRLEYTSCDYERLTSGRETVVVEHGTTIDSAMREEAAAAIAKSRELLGDEDADDQSVDPSQPSDDVGPGRLVEIGANGRREVLYGGDHELAVMDGGKHEYIEGDHTIYITGSQKIHAEGDVEEEEKGNKWSVTHGNEWKKRYGDKEEHIHGNKREQIYGSTNKLVLGGSTENIGPFQMKTWWGVKMDVALGVELKWYPGKIEQYEFACKFVYYKIDDKKIEVKNSLVGAIQRNLVIGTHDLMVNLGKAIVYASG